MYFQDESRFGLFTKTGRMLTAKGIKPICSSHQEYSSTWLFGAFSPISGDDFMMEFPVCNTETFQIFLNEFSNENPNTLIIIVLDNGAFHKAKRLKIPHNITLLFLPPYAPELNPAEKIWHHIKRKFTNKYFNMLSEISDFFSHTIQNITSDMVKSIGSYSYLSLNSFWAD